MSEKYLRRLKNSIIIISITAFFIAVLLILYYLYQNGYFTSSESQDISSILNKIGNESINNLSLVEFCDLLQNNLNKYKIGDVKQEWRCFAVYEENKNYSDVVFNKTEGLCNCTNVLSNGQPLNIQIRKAKG